MRKFVILAAVILTGIFWPSGTGANSFASSQCLMNWANRIQLTIDHTKIDATLMDFPVRIHIDSAKTAKRDSSNIFTELRTNSQKIAITTADGFSQCYVEIDNWNADFEEADLWVKVPSISSRADTLLYLYYDRNQADNTAYVGDTGSVPAQNVWNNGFVEVQHLGQSGNGTSGEFKDSTARLHDGTGGNGDASGTPARTTAKIGDGQYFDGSNDYINIPDSDDFSISNTMQLTISFWISPHLLQFHSRDYIHYLGKGQNGQYEWAFRLYNLSFRERPQSFSLYTWNPQGGEGAGARWDHPQFQVDSWIFITGRFGRIDGSSDISLFGDGNPVEPIFTDSYASVRITPTNGPAPLRLGTENRANWFDGRLDEVRVSNTARSNAWIKADYYSQNDDLINFEILKPLQTGDYPSIGAITPDSGLDSPPNIPEDNTNQFQNGSGDEVQSPPLGKSLLIILASLLAVAVIILCIIRFYRPHLVRRNPDKGAHINI
jgi:hypothetical protein